MSFVLSFLGSKLGGYAVAGIIAAILGGALYIDGLRLDATKADLRAANIQLADAAEKNAGYVKKLDDVTADLADAKDRASHAVADLAAASARVEVKTITITKEINHAATIADDARLPPGFRAALDGLRDAYPDAR